MAREQTGRLGASTREREEGRVRVRENIYLFVIFQIFVNNRFLKNQVVVVSEEAAGA